MRISIEFELPDGQRIPTEHEIKMLTSDDWVIDAWHIDDVKNVESDLDDDECREVLRRVYKYRDAIVGINRGVIEYHANEVLSEREQI